MTFFVTGAGPGKGVDWENGWNCWWRSRLAWRDVIRDSATIAGDGQWSAIQTPAQLPAKGLRQSGERIITVIPCGTAESSPALQIRTTQLPREGPPAAGELWRNLGDDVWL